MQYKVSGNNFHGSYLATFRSRDGWLSARQTKRLDYELCGVSDCRCGGLYGSGPDDDSARVIDDSYDAAGNCIVRLGNRTK
jgi:hypothetical protein